MFSLKLREERERLGLSQEELATIGGVSRVTQGKYERGERKPDVDYLNAIAAIGVDIQYVITSKRTLPDPRLQAMSDLMEALTEKQRGEILAAIEEKKQLNQLIEIVEQVKKKRKVS